LLINTPSIGVESALSEINYLLSRFFRKNIFLHKTRNMSSDKENQDKKKQPQEGSAKYEVTVQGSLGLLAMGAAGIKAWRLKREEEKQNAKPTTEHE
jgi:hypothetical protein